MVDLESAPREFIADGEAGSVDFKMITFILAGKEYGVDIMSVKEIQKGSRFTYVPNVPQYVRGVYNLRGDIIPVIDLRNFFGLPEYEDKQEMEDILILKQGDSIVGVIVDSIQKVVGIDSHEIQPAHPIFADVVGLNYIYGIVEKDEDLYIILDTPVILGNQKKDEDQKDEEVEHKTVAQTTAAPEVPASTVQEVVPLPAAPAPNVEQIPVQATPVVQQSAPVPVVQEVVVPVAEVPVVEEVIPASSFANIADDTHEDGPSEAFCEGLFEYANFCPSELNQEWLFKRYDQWSASHPGLGKPGAQTTREFLGTFYSAYGSELWPDDMVEEFCELVGQDDQKITHIWNIGCGQGFMAYSVAGGLFLRDKKCKVYATDSDLFSITGAPGLTFVESEVPQDFKLAMVEGPKGWQFSNDVKNTIIFEYHDIANEHSFPKLDVIIVRDHLSFVDEEVFMKFFDRIFKQAHPGTLLIIGDNEKLMDHGVWSPVQSHYFSAYRKIV